METHNDPRLALPLLVRDRLFSIRVAQKRKDGSIHAGAWLDHMGDKTLFCFLIEIIERFSTCSLVLLQIVVRTICHTFQLLHPERELIFDVVGSLGIKGSIRVRDRKDAKFVPRHADVLVEFYSLFLPT